MKTFAERFGKNSERQGGELFPALKRVGPKPPPKSKPDMRNDPRYMQRPLRPDEVYVPPKDERPAR